MPGRAAPGITPPQVVAQKSEPAAEPQPSAAAAPAPSVVAAPVSQRPQELLSKPTEQAMPPPLAPAGRAVASAAPVGQTAGGVPETAPPPPAGQVETKALANRVDLAAADVARERETGAVIVSPGSQIRWRLGARGEIGRSEDGGVTWAVQNAGTSQELLAGSAPSDDVLWVVGRGGTILKTTDGRSWSRIDSPVPDDVVSVEATDAATATIRTADGQRYVTRDGGKSWERQEH
ncbi:MAG: hypothetical protein HY654_04470 [Acidobacteria bacterium]|nr:hypothetical protein [Acidobacteriota bacterium]